MIISAFSEEQVERLTGISKRQLRYWDRTDFFTPAFANENRRVAYSRIYSFTDVASLRVLNILRNQYCVPLQHLRQVARDLPQMSTDKWTRSELYVLNRRVVLLEPGTNKYREVVGNQYVMGIVLSVIVRDTKRDIEALSVRGKDLIGKIGRARNVCHNAWVIAGTRVPVAAIKQFAKKGYKISQIRDEYPTLTEADIESAIRYEGDGIAA